MKSLASGFAIASALLFAPSPALAAEGWAWPVRGEILTHYRNGADPYAAGQHRGIDIAAADGTSVNAATAGSVTFAGSAGSAGLTVSMRTADGRFDLSHLHLSALSVKEGDQLAAGDRVGSVGTSGRRSHPRPHLHFGVREAARQHAYLDPLTLLSSPALPPEPRGAPVPAPARPVPAAAPVPAPRPARVPASRPVPRSAPRRLPGRRPGPARRPRTVRRPLPVPTAKPRPASRPLGRPAAAPRSAPALTARPLSSPDRLAERGASGERAPAHGGPSAASLGRGSPLLASPPVAEPPAPTREVTARASDPDIGWLLACLGVGLAALLLAWSPAARSARTVVRAAVEALRRPLFGPR